MNGATGEVIRGDPLEASLVAAYRKETQACELQHSRNLPVKELAAPELGHRRGPAASLGAERGHSLAMARHGTAPERFQAREVKG